MSRSARWVMALLVGVCAACDGGGGPEGTGGRSDASPPEDAGVRLVADAAPRAEVCISDDECPAGEYCAAPEGELVGACRPGCREEPGACGERMLCVDRACVPDPSCHGDEDCPATAYCDDGTCTEGCRLLAEGACPPGEGGAERRCDPDTRTCVAFVPCCTAEDVCEMVVETDCAAPVTGQAACTPEVCSGRCAGDADCAPDAYCGDAGRCAPGCRPQEPGACPGEICDEETRTCVPLRCEADDECAADRYCDDFVGGCVLGCRRSPDTCPRGQFCNTVHECGEACGEDAQCANAEGEGWYCARGVCHPPCTQHVDCAANEACSAGRCAVGCRDDAHEENDEREAATPIVLEGGVYRSQGEDLHVCPRDRDWFSFEVPPPGAAVTVRLVFRHVDGDLDLRLHAPDGRVHESRTADDDERVEVLEGPAGTWHVEAFGRGVAENDYELRVEASTAGICLADAVDPGDDGPAGATAVELPDLQGRQVFRGRTLCADDTDWFAIDLGDRDGLTVRLTALDAADLTFGLYGPGLPAAGAAAVLEPNSAGGGGGQPRYVELSVPRGNELVRAGRWYVGAAGFDEEQAGRYELSVTVDRFQALCLVDRAEANDTRASAFELLSVEGFSREGVGGAIELRPGVNLDLRDLWLCGGDEDWYRLPLGAGDELEATVLRHDATVEGTVIVEVRDARGEVVGLPGRNARAVNGAVLFDAAPGNYYVRVAADDARTQTQYTLRLGRIPGVAGCPADGFEGGAGNDDRAAAPRVAPGEYPNLTLCGAEGDVDWYVLETGAPGDVTVEIQFAQAQADLELDVFYEDALVAENANEPAGHSHTDHEQVALAARPAGRYFIRVMSLGAGNAAYTLRISAEARVFVCDDDPDEPNDELEDATPLGSRPLDRATQWLCDRQPIESDWFEIDVPANTVRTVAATFLFGDDGDLALEVYDLDGMRLATTASIPRNISKQCVIIDPFRGDRFLFVRVVPLNINRAIEEDERLDYRLIVRDGDACDAIGQPTPGVQWPHAEAPF